MQSSTAVGLVVLVVLAGCGGFGGVGTAPTDTPSNASQPTDGPGTPDGTEPTDATTATQTTERVTAEPSALAGEYTITVENGELPVNYSLVYARTADMLDRKTVAPPERVVIQSNEEMPTFQTRYSPFERAFGLQVPPDREATFTAAAIVRSADRVEVNRGILDDPDDTERILGHESVHVIQIRADAMERTEAVVFDRPRTTEKLYAATGVQEGTAEWVQWEYERRYIDSDATPQADSTRSYRNLTAGRKLSFAPYHYGALYVEKRIDDPAQLQRVYQNPPRTTEELLHGLPPGSEPVAELTVLDGRSDDWGVVPDSRDTKGELFLRVAFTSALNRSAAARAADGWGADTQLELTAPDSDGAGYAWVHRWDDAANASEFDRLAREFLNRTADERVATADGVVWRTANTTYRFVRLSDRTTAFLVGPSDFVRNATLSQNGTTVTVGVSEPEERLAPPAVEAGNGVPNRGIADRRGDDSLRITDTPTDSPSPTHVVSSTPTDHRVRSR